MLSFFRALSDLKYLNYLSIIHIDSQNYTIYNNEIDHLTINNCEIEMHDEINSLYYKIFNHNAFQVQFSLELHIYLNFRYNSSVNLNYNSHGLTISHKNQKKHFDLSLADSFSCTSSSDSQLVKYLSLIHI